MSTVSDDIIWDFEEQSGDTDQYVAHYSLEHQGVTHNVSIAKMREGSYIVAAHIVGAEWLPYTQIPQGSKGQGFPTLEEALAEAEEQARARARPEQAESTDDES
jgi:hypothetical protein